MILVGLAGRAGSGKSTCASWLRHHRHAVEFSLANPLKLLAQDVFGFSDDQVFGTQAQKEAVDPRWGISPREALIRLGNGARERIGADVWIDALMNTIRRARPIPEIAVVADVRYANEARRIREVGGHVILLRCLDADTKVDPNAPSERSVDEIDEADLTAIVVANRSPGAEELLGRFTRVWKGIEAEYGIVSDEEEE